MTLDEIIEQSPDIPIYGGGKWAMYSVGCCWWTSFPEDLGVTGEHRLPCCPHCKSVLMQAPLLDFVDAARANPDHYGSFCGLDVFTSAHSRNANWCRPTWYDYQIRFWLRHLPSRAQIDDILGEDHEQEVG